jgi:hypothetical protein
MLIGRVVHDEVGDDPQTVGMGRLEENLKVGCGAVVGMHGAVIRYVIPIVAERGGVEGKEPETIHPELLEVVESTGQPGEVSDAVAVGVLKGADVQLVKDGVFVPEGVAQLAPQRK